MIKPVLPVVTIVLMLAACTRAPDARTPEQAVAPDKAVGSERDAHGCIPSAGYAWCAHTARCERPWELAQQQQLAAGSAAFSAYCEQR